MGGTRGGAQWGNQISIKPGGWNCILGIGTDGVFLPPEKSSKIFH